MATGAKSARDDVRAVILAPMVEDPTLPTTDLGSGEPPDTAGAPVRPPAGLNDAPEPPEIPDRYELTAVAGSGGFGTVRCAHDRLLDRSVAIKFLHDRSTQSQSVLKEARAAAALHHPNLALVLDVDSSAVPRFLVMEWVQGLPLDRAWGSSLRQRVEMLCMVCSGVAALHDAGLVHADIKPSNVLVDKGGTPKVIDFGLTAQGGGVGAGGTPGYAAPEQFTHGKSITARADVFAIGVLLFEAITGTRPYRADTPAALAALVCASDPPLPTLFAPDLPPALQRICLKAMERDPANRYIDATDLLDDLRRYLTGEEVLARPTMLQSTYLGGLERHEQDYREWRRAGLLTAAEAERGIRHVEVLRAPESDWIIETRRITAGRLLMYVGGWMTIVALVVGVSRAWESFGRSSIAVATAMLAFIVGAAALATALKRRALGHILSVASVLAAGGYVWLLAQQGYVYPTPVPGRELLTLMIDNAPPGFTSLQLIVISAVVGVYAAFLRLCIASSAFTLLLTTAIIVAGLSVAARITGVPPDQENPFGLPRVLACQIPILLTLLIIGLAVERATGDRESSRVWLRDASTLLGVAVPYLVTIASVLAWSAPAWYWFGTADEDPDRDLRALAFLLNGAAWLGLALLLGRCAPRSGRAHTLFLRWLVPSHALGALVVLENEEAIGVWWPWLLLLFAASAIFLVASAFNQWKPFVISGLLGIALGYARLFPRARDLFGDQSWPAAALALIGFILGAIAVWAGWQGSGWWLVRFLAAHRRKRAGDRLVPPSGASAAPHAPHQSSR